MLSVCRDRLAAAGLRVELDDRQEKINYKIREAQLQKVPYMLVAGDRESAEGTVASAQPVWRRPWCAAGRRVHRGRARRNPTEKPAWSNKSHRGTRRSQSVARGGRYRIRSLAQT